MPETLYLIDAYAQIFRAYYAIRGGMRSPVTGEPTHAVFGIAGMLLKLCSQLRPDYVVVAADAPGKTFRDDLFPHYKAMRQATPDDLVAQVPRVFELVELFGIPVISRPGLEADDVIASITHRVLADARCRDVDVRIVSKDKDLEQLLCDRVALFDVHTDTTIDIAALLVNKGITPAQVVDVLALTGDSVDNVPGVAGIGPKTAAQLVQQFGSIDGIFANLDQIKGKRRENLEQARAHLPLSRTLVTLKVDADLAFSLDAARFRPPDPQRLIPFFRQLGFNRYQEEVRRLAGLLEPLTPIPSPSRGEGSHDGNGQVGFAGDLAPAGFPPRPLGERGPGGEGTRPNEMGPGDEGGRAAERSPHPSPLPKGEGISPRPRGERHEQLDGAGGRRRSSARSRRRTARGRSRRRAPRAPGRRPRSAARARRASGNAG